MLLLAGVAFGARDFYDHSAKTIHGEKVKLRKFESPVALVVNVASLCGSTDGDYKALQSLHEKYHSKGLTIMAFPSDTFRQEPTTDDHIYEWASKKYNVGFLMFSKVDVNGKGRFKSLPFEYLKSTLGGGPVKWNFEKFLIVGGKPVKRYDRMVNPMDIAPEIDAALAQAVIDKAEMEEALYGNRAGLLEEDDL